MIIATKPTTLSPFEKIYFEEVIHSHRVLWKIILQKYYWSCQPYLYLTLILLRLFQQHYCYNVTGQSQESEGSCKPARIKEVHSKLHSFQASLCTLTATHLTLIYVCTCIRLSVPLGCLIKQAGIIIHTILNMWETLLKVCKLSVHLHVFKCIFIVSICIYMHVYR